MKNINLQTIRIDGGTQSRVSLNESAVSDYADALKNGVALPPIVVFYDGSDFWLADGFHRYHAYRQEKRASIPAEVHEGTNREAIFHAIGANQAHGLRRTNKDKRNAVRLMLADPEWAAWSDRNIAKHCGVTHPFVSAIRAPRVVTVTTPEAAKAAVKAESDSTPELVLDQSDQLAEAQDTVVALSDRVEELTAKLAVEQMDTSEEAKGEAAQIIAELRGQVKTLEAENAALRISRDKYQSDVHELMRQLKINKREFDRARAA